MNILEESGIDYSSIVQLADQNINVFDKSGAFYTDLCFEFDSPSGRDITLEDRIKEFYPNVSLCDDGCTSKGVNLTTMNAICSCDFFRSFSWRIPYAFLFDYCRIYVSLFLSKR